MMRPVTSVWFCFLILVSGCGSGHSTFRTTWQEFLQVQKELNDSLASIKDTASAEQARTKLKQLADRLRATGEKIKGFSGEPSAADKQWFEKECLPTLQSTGMKTVEILTAIKDPELKKQAAQIVMEFTQTAQPKTGAPAK
jgi:hypothetical protein